MSDVFALFISSSAPFAPPGAPFVLSAGLIAVSLLLALSLLKAPRVRAELSAD